MVKRAIVFPGQGSQYTGMGKDLYDNFQNVRDVFNQVDDLLQYKLSKIILEGPKEKLMLTKHAQPAIMTISAVLLQKFCDIAGISEIASMFDYVAGHSLGEYTALYAVNSLSFQDTIRLLKIRGESMDNATSQVKTAMAACIGIDFYKVQSIIDAHILPNSICQIANDNSNSQVVISGEEHLIKKISAHIKELGFRSVLLNVSGAFHSDFMIPAQNIMRKELLNTQINQPDIPILLNTTAHISNDISEIRQNLVDQIVSTVRWREIMNILESQQITEIVEIGPGKILAGLFKANSSNFQVKNISSLQDIEKFSFSI